MAKIYNMESNRKSKEDVCYSLEFMQVEAKHSSTYFEILDIFRKVFALVDKPFSSKEEN